MYVPRSVFVLGLGIVVAGGGFLAMEWRGTALVPVAASQPVVSVAAVAPQVAVPKVAPSTVAPGDAQTGEKLQIPILFFHHVEDPQHAPENARNLFYAPEKLEELLKLLKERGYTAIRQEDLLPGGVIPKKAVALTFDDGYDSHYAAAQMLARYGQVGTFYIVTGLLDTPGYLSRTQVKEMAEMGMEIGSHTVTHADLTKLSPEKLKKELTESKASLEKLIGKKVDIFCYPAGKYDAKVVEATKAAGYTTARTVERKWVTDRSKPYDVPGIRVLPDTGLASYRKWFD